MNLFRLFSKVARSKLQAEMYKYTSFNTCRRFYNVLMTRPTAINFSLMIMTDYYYVLFFASIKKICLLIGLTITKNNGKAEETQ